MKRIIQLLILLILSTVVYSQQLTNEQVIQIVKDFENNQNLSNLNVSVYEFDGIIDFWVTQTNNNFNKKWVVKPNVDSVVRYTNYNEIDNELEQSDSNYTQDQCISIALNYLNSKNINILNYIIEDDDIEWKDGNYCYCMRKIINSNLKIPSINLIVIHINSFSGNISYFSHSYNDDMIISQEPELTDAQVTQIVNNIFGENNISVLNIGGYGYNENYDGISRLAFINNNDYMVEIDAFSHNVIGIYASASCNYDKYKNININANKNEYNSKNAKETIKLKKQPYKELSDEELKGINVDNKNINFILCNTESSKNIKYIELSKDYVIDKVDNGIARMEAGENKFIFRNGSYWCFINNKTYNMGGNCIIENGKLKLPEEFYKKVQDKDYQFFRK